MPARVEGYPWSLAFGSENHGFSLSQLYRNLHDVDSPVLLIIKTTNDEVRPVFYWYTLQFSFPAFFFTCLSCIVPVLQHYILLFEMICSMWSASLLTRQFIIHLMDHYHLKFGTVQNRILYVCIYFVDLWSIIFLSISYVWSVLWHRWIFSIYLRWRI